MMMKRHQSQLLESIELKDPLVTSWLSLLAPYVFLILHSVAI